MESAVQDFSIFVSDNGGAIVVTEVPPDGYGVCRGSGSHPVPSTAWPPIMPGTFRLPWHWPRQLCHSQRPCRPLVDRPHHRPAVERPHHRPAVGDLTTARRWVTYRPYWSDLTTTQWWSDLTTAQWWSDLTTSRQFRKSDQRWIDNTDHYPGNSDSSTNGGSTSTTSGNSGSSTNGGSTAPTTSGNQITSTTPVVPVVQVHSEPTPGAPFTNPNAPTAIVAEAPPTTNLAALTDSGLTVSTTSGNTGSTLASANRSTAAGQSSLLAAFSAFFSTVVSASGPTGTFETGTITLQASASPNSSGPVTGSPPTAQVGGGDTRAASTFAQAIQDVNAVFQETIQDSETAVGDAIRKTINQAQGAIGQPPPVKVKPDDQDPEEEEPSQVLLDVQPSDLQCCDAAFANLDDLLVSVPRLGLENQEKEDEQFGQSPWDVQQPEMRHRDAAFSGLNAMLGAALFVAGGQAAAWREQPEPSRRKSDKKNGDKLLPDKSICGQCFVRKRHRVEKWVPAHPFFNPAPLLRQ